MVSDQQTPRASSPVGGTVLWIFLALSLAGNAFLVGTMLRHGPSFRGWHRPPIGASEAVPNPRTFWHGMSPTMQREFMKTLVDRREDIQRHFKELVESRRAEFAAMKAEPFDPEAYRKALEHSAEIDANARKDAIDFFVKTVAQMPAQERKELAERLEDGMNNWDGLRPFREMRRDRAPGAAEMPEVLGQPGAPEPPVQ